MRSASARKSSVTLTRALGLADHGDPTSGGDPRPPSPRRSRGPGPRRPGRAAGRRTPSSASTCRHRRRRPAAGRGRPGRRSASAALRDSTLPAWTSDGSAAGMPSVTDSRPFSLRLERVPVRLDLLGRRRRWPSPNTCGWRATSLVDDAVGDVVDRPRLVGVLGGDAGVEHHLQQQVAELLAQPVASRLLDRLDGLVGLLDEVLDERRVRLPGVPRAAARASAAGPSPRRGRAAARRAGRAVARHQPSGGRRGEVVGRRAEGQRRRVPGAVARARPSCRAPSLSAMTASTTAWPCSSAEPFGASAMPSSCAWRFSVTIGLDLRRRDALLDEQSARRPPGRPACAVVVGQLLVDLPLGDDDALALGELSTARW